MKLRTVALSLATLVIGGLLAGCSSPGIDAPFDEPREASDALPGVQGEMFDDLDPESSRYLGDVDGTRYWAARSTEGWFCLAAQVADDPEQAMTACSPGDGDSITISGAGFPSATWSASPGPDVSDGRTVLRDHLVVTSS